MKAADGPGSAVFFDCDGVLLESAQIKTDAFAVLFADHPEHVEAIVDLHVRHGGISRYQKFEWIFRDILEAPLDAEESVRLGARYTEIVLDALLSCPLVPGAVETLQALRATHRCAVVSGSPDDELRFVLERRGLLHLVDRTFGAPHEKARSMRVCLEDWGIPVARAAMVGDASSDLDAATSLGIRFIGRVPPGEPAPFPRGVPVVADLTNLIALLRAPAGEAQTT